MVNRFGKREENQQTPGAQDPNHNDSDNIKISSQDKAGIKKKTLPAAEQNPDGFDPLPGVISDVPDVIGQKNQSHQNPKGDGDIKSLQGKNLPLNRIKFMT